MTGQSISCRQIYFLLKVEVALLFIASFAGYRFDYPLLSDRIQYLKKLLKRPVWTGFLYDTSSDSLLKLLLDPRIPLELAGGTCILISPRSSELLEEIVTQFKRSIQRRSWRLAGLVYHQMYTYALKGVNTINGISSSSCLCWI